MKPIKLKKIEYGYTIVIVGIAIMIIIIVSIIFPLKKIPEGLPNDYYDVISTIEESDANIYMFSDTIDFNEHYEAINIVSVDDLPEWRYGIKNFLVIDMEKYSTDNFATQEQIENLYHNECYYILIVNNESSNSTALEGFIDPFDSNSDLITYTYDQCHVNHYTGVNVGEFPSHQILMYAILDEITRIIEGV